jgi:hypothetical protein
MYKGIQYFKDKDGFWKVHLGNDELFIVALDDSKECGRKTIVSSNNSEDACKRFIDWKLTVE